jgi:hypothetical protein
MPLKIKKTMEMLQAFSGKGLQAIWTGHIEETAWSKSRYVTIEWKLWFESCESSKINKNVCEVL